MTDKENSTNENKFTNKIQIRARILSAIVNLQKNSQVANFVKEEIAELKTISDTQAVMDVLVKEFLKENPELKDYTISFLMKELVPQEEKEKVLYEYLANKKINDNLKTKIVSLLRESGKHIKYEQYTEYFENPDSIIDSDTEKLLENAKVNPESQVDFLDFLTALPQQEKELLLNSLEEDYDGNNLANILIPVIMSNPYSEIASLAITAIGASRSQLAFPVLHELLDIVDDPKVKSNVQKSLSMLKLSGIKEDTTKEYYKKLLSDSPVFNCSVSFPDGHGNIGMIFSRKNEIDFIRMFALVFNDTDGIVDCFGFNEITKSEFTRILAKFYQNNDVVQISAPLAKYLMVTAENATRKVYKEVPYEYVVWKGLTNDIEYEDIDIKKDLQKIDINDESIKTLYSQSYFDTWFMSVEDDNNFAQLMKKIEDEKISNVDEIASLIENEKSKIFSQENISMINNRLIKCAAFANIEERAEHAKILYSLSFESDLKNKFLTDYLKKSVYQHFLIQKEKYISLKQSTSIFTRKRDLNEIDIKFVELCIENIEKSWV